jgi:phenylacetate-CoA ligase
VYVEVLRANNTPSLPGEVGKVVLTHLTNYPMPFIRYEVGDMAALSDRSCGCGRTLPLLERIEGRVADYVVTPRGVLVSGISLTENFSLLVPGIAQLQIVQERIDHFVFRIVKAPEFGPDSHNSIRRLVAERFGEDVTFECEFMDCIRQEASGKYRFVISKVDKPTIAKSYIAR